MIVETFLTVLKLSIDQILGTLEQLGPTLVHNLLDPPPRTRAEILDCPVVEHGRALFITTTTIVTLPLLKLLLLQTTTTTSTTTTYISQLVLEPVVERRPPATAEHKATNEEKEKVTR